MEDVKAKNASSARTGTVSWIPSSENSAGHKVFVDVIECALGGNLLRSGVEMHQGREGKLVVGRGRGEWL